jgi:hypothetical protein
VRPTDTGNWLSLINDLVTKEVSLAEYKDGEDCSSEDWYLYGAQEKSYHIVDPLHPLVGCAIRPLDHSACIVGFAFIAKTFLPVDFEDFVPHRNEGEDGRDAARCCHKSSGVESELGWDRNHIYIVSRASSYGRKRSNDS